MKISSITSTVAITAISLATLTNSGEINLILPEPNETAIYEPYLYNLNISKEHSASSNSSIFSYLESNENYAALNRRISDEVFGEMRYLSPEENARKLEMYRNMSTIVAGVNFFD